MPIFSSGFLTGVDDSQAALGLEPDEEYQQRREEEELEPEPVEEEPNWWTDVIRDRGFFEEVPNLPAYKPGRYDNAQPWAPGDELSYEPPPTADSNWSPDGSHFNNAGTIGALPYGQPIPGDAGFDDPLPMRTLESRGSAGAYGLENDPGAMTEEPMPLMPGGAVPGPWQGPQPANPPPDWVLEEAYNRGLLPRPEEIGPETPVGGLQLYGATQPPSQEEIAAMEDQAQFGGVRPGILDQGNTWETAMLQSLPLMGAGAPLRGSGVVRNLLGAGSMDALPFAAANIGGEFGARALPWAADELGASPGIQAAAMFAGGLGGAVGTLAAPAATRALGRGAVNYAENAVRGGLALDPGMEGVMRPARPAGLMPVEAPVGGGARRGGEKAAPAPADGPLPDWIKDNNANLVAQADQIKVSKAIETLARQKLTADDIVSRLGNKLDSIPADERANLVRAVRGRAGIEAAGPPGFMPGGSPATETPTGPATPEVASTFTSALGRSPELRTKFNAATQTPADMRQLLDAAGWDSSGTRAHVTTRFTALRDTVNGKVPDAGMRARAVYETALEATGNPESARRAARRASNPPKIEKGRIVAPEPMEEVPKPAQGLSGGRSGDLPPDKGGKQGGFGSEWTSDPEPSKPFWTRVVDNATATASAPMALLTTISPLRLRQGLIRGILNPRQAAKSTAQSMKAAFTDLDSRALNQALLDDVWSSPYSSKGQLSPFKGYTASDVDMVVRDWGPKAATESRAAEFQGLNESGVSTFVQALPQVKYSGRQFALEFNADVLGRYGEVAQRKWDMEEALKIPHVKKEYAELARVIERQEQYGSLKQGRIPVVFSMPAISGRVQAVLDLSKAITDPKGMFKPGATQEAVKGGIAMIIGTTAMMYLTAEALPGFDFDTSRGIPRLKTPLGSIDPYAGWGTMARLLYDAAAIIGDSDEDNSDETIDKLIGRSAEFLRGQNSPAASEVTTFATGKDWSGRTIKRSEYFAPAKMGVRLTAPMLAHSLYEGYTNYGWKGAVAAGAIEGLSGNINQRVSPTDKIEKGYKEYAEDIQGLFPPEVKLPTDDYWSLTPREREVARGFLKDKDPQALADWEKDQERSETVFAKARQKVDAAWDEQNPQLDALYKSVFDGGKGPEINDEVDAIRTAIRNIKDHEYGQPEYKKAVAELPKTDISKTIDEYYSIPDEVGKAKGYIDWDVAKKVQGAYVAQLNASDPDLANRLAWNVQSKKDPNAHPLIQLYDEAAPMFKAYYAVDSKERDAYRRANPETDYVLWLLGKVDTVRSEKAAELAQKTTNGRTIKLR